MGLTLLLGSFVLGLAIGLPVAVTLGLSSMAYLLFADIPWLSSRRKCMPGWTALFCSAFQGSFWLVTL